MIELSSEIKLIKNGLLNFEGSKFLFDLYLPLIGSDATFLYLFFANKVKKEEDDSQYSQEKTLVSVYQVFIDSNWCFNT